VLKNLLYFLLFLVSFTTAEAQEFVFSSNCIKAYNNIIALKIDSGKYFLRQEAKSNPKNRIPELLHNYIDFLEIYTSNSTEAYTAKRKDFDARLKAIRNADAKSPYYLFAQAEIHLQAAVLHIKFGEYFSAVVQVKKSLNRLEENHKKFPDFKPNLKTLGTLYTILGSIPQQYKAGMSFFGLSGSINKGMQMLESLVLDKDFMFQHEAATIYAFLQLHIANNPDKAWTVLKGNGFFNSTNLMDTYSVGHIGIHGTHNDEGLKALLNRPQSDKYLDFNYLNFLIGLGKTYRQDADANAYFSKFIKNNKGADYVKSAYHKMAWNELIEGNTEQYYKYINLVPTAGRAVLDTDKQAEKEQKTASVPNPKLLKVRLLSDGNYSLKALELIKQYTVNDFDTVEHKTEYFYRYGRLYDKLNQHEKAVQFYELTINNGRNIEHYYAANSAYLLGYLHEKKQNTADALKYYELCLLLNGYEYDNSIKQKAKAGINRLKG
jgi:tetratricopeptide (TPR) repeat protein